MVGYYKNEEVKIIGQNFYDYLIYIYDKEKDDYITKIVPKKEVKAGED